MTARPLLGRLKRWSRDRFWDVYGRRLTNPPPPSSPSSFLFICKGNICRSPFAEHLMKQKAAAEGLPPVRASSAGLQVGESIPAPAEALEAAAHFGIDLSDHRSRALTADMLSAFDMVLVMEAQQRSALKRVVPGTQDRFFLLPLFEMHRDISLKAFQRWNILDPYGKGLSLHIECFRRIEICIQGLLRRTAHREPGV